MSAIELLKLARKLTKARNVHKEHSSGEICNVHIHGLCSGPVKPAKHGPGAETFVELKFTLISKIKLQSMLWLRLGGNPVGLRDW
jgi:hypothetical protein